MVNVNGSNIWCMLVHMSPCIWLMYFVHLVHVSDSCIMYLIHLVHLSGSCICVWCMYVVHVNGSCIWCMLVHVSACIWLMYLVHLVPVSDS